MDDSPAQRPGQGRPGDIELDSITRVLSAVKVLVPRSSFLPRPPLGMMRPAAQHCSSSGGRAAVAAVGMSFAQTLRLNPLRARCCRRHSGGLPALPLLPLDPVQLHARPRERTVSGRVAHSPVYARAFPRIAETLLTATRDGSPRTRGLRRGSTGGRRRTRSWRS